MDLVVGGVRRASASPDRTKRPIARFNINDGDHPSTIIQPRRHTEDVFAELRIPEASAACDDAVRGGGIAPQPVRASVLGFENGLENENPYY